MALPQDFDVENPVCPKCGGEMWDNRTKKARGEYKSSRSDFSCKDKEACGYGIWIGGKGAKPAQQAPGVASSKTAKPSLSPADRKAGRDKVFADYLGLMTLVAERMAGIAKQHGAPLDMGNVQAATYSIYGEMRARGFLSPPPKAAAAAPAPRAAAPSPAQRPAAAPVPEVFEEDPYLEAEDDLPF